MNVVYIIPTINILHPIVVSFLVGAGFGWCLCSLVDFIRKYLEMKRDQKKSERTWAELRPYLEHCMEHAEGGITWVSYEELRERRKKQNEQLCQHQVGGDTEETSSTT